MLIPDNDLQRSLKGMRDEPFDCTPMSCASVAGDALDEIRELRMMLAISISGGCLYRDDGELQDNSSAPFIDWKRDTVKGIQEKLRLRVEKALRKANRESTRGQADEGQNT